MRALFFGMMVGLVLGLLLAPKPGNEMIEMIRGQ